MAGRSRLHRLLHPRSVALIGGREAAEAARQCRRMGYEGEVWPVHPTKESVEGYPAFRSVDDLPAAPDAVFLGVNRTRTIEVVAALARRGAGGVVCYAAGFSETGPEGEALQARLLAAAEAMPVVGPNCYGMINYLDGALLWPDQHGGARTGSGVAILAQSSNIAMNLSMQRRGLPIAFLAALGNQFSVTTADLIEALAADPRVTAIGLYVEGVGDPQALDRAMRTARTARTPVVALKAGRSESAGALTLSHTASVSGSDAAMDALFCRLGIARVRSLGEMLETLRLLHCGGPLPGADIVSLSCSGGEACLMADAAEGRAVRFRPFDTGQTARIAATVDPLVTVGNPFDYHAFMWRDGPRMARTFSEVLACSFALAVLVLDIPRLDRCDPASWLQALGALQSAAAVTGARAAMLSTLPETLPESVAAQCLAHGIVPLSGIEDGLAAIEAAAFIGAAWDRSEPLPLAAPTALSGEGRLLSEHAAKAMLARYGLAVPEGQLCRTATEAVAAAGGFPVVVKLSGTAHAHKSDVGGVALNLRGEAAVRDAATAMLRAGGTVLVERMVTDVVAELLVGVARDPVIGLHIVLGAGGILVEILRDSRALLLPVDPVEARAALDALRIAPLLRGHRGRPAGDVEAVVAAIEAVGQFALDHADRLVELDINPLLVQAQGTVAVDALIRLTGGAA